MGELCPTAVDSRLRLPERSPARATSAPHAFIRRPSFRFERKAAEPQYGEARPEP
ncbi:hypothetical protein AB0K02_10730 [Streptomyces sp. NPDC049597]|uniref:hypothetical protein n=1 Tax=Streptomyces sp. NPDC049597 TaxID=3155276 RepID=UPI003419E363